MPRSPVREMLFTAYMVGQVHAVEKGPAGFYWFHTLPFDAEGARTITDLFLCMSRLFRDKGGDTVCSAATTTSRPAAGPPHPLLHLRLRADVEVTIPQLQSSSPTRWCTTGRTFRTPRRRGHLVCGGQRGILLHRHSHGDGPLLPGRDGKVINQKAGSYYSNPMRHLSNLELGKLYWTDRRCRQVPYARGMLYLSNLDADIRRRTADSAAAGHRGPCWSWTTPPRRIFSVWAVKLRALTCGPAMKPYYRRDAPPIPTHSAGILTLNPAGSRPATPDGSPDPAPTEFLDGYRWTAM